MATSIDTFTQDEVQLMQQAIADVIFGAIASDPPGALGTMKEVIGGARGMAQSLKDAHSDLLEQILESQSGDTDNATPNQEMFESKESCEALMAKGVASAVNAHDVLRAKAEPAEARGFAMAVIATAQHAVEATSKGGFLGIGGERVSPSESAYVSRLTQALN